MENTPEHTEEVAAAVAPEAAQVDVAAPGENATPAPAPSPAPAPAPAPALAGVADRWFAFADKPVPNFIIRLGVMMAGITAVAFGIALSRATDLGLGAISTIPGVLNYAIPGITLGTFTFAFNILLVLLQIVILRRRFHAAQLLAIPFLLVFSAIIDFFVPFCMAIPFANYPLRLLGSVVSCAFIALGVWLQTKGALVLLPGDGFTWSVSSVTGWEFGRTKVITDCTLLSIAAVISLIMMGGLFGVREGSIMAALLIGFVIRGFNRLVPNFERFAPTKGHVTWIPRKD